MIEIIKDKIAGFVVSGKLKEHENNLQSFFNVFSKSFTYFVVMPEDESDFNHSFEVLNYLDSNRKTPIAFTYEFKVSLLPQKFRARAVGYKISDMNKLKLPSHSLIKKLKDLNFNVVLDLNRKESIFNSYAANLVKSPVRIGYRKNNSDKYYNLQFNIEETDPQISYKKLLNCLQMF
ncbi:MAG: hypothetical protein IPM56_19060 [Ignavibacteriales bacterium]|nr:MAG: hypothetical protein IPM56_19060 [Ignavibacteriales bacterium]